MEEDDMTIIQDKVLGYVENNLHDTLYFDEGVKPKTISSTKELVYNILEMTEHYSSRAKNGQVETYPNRARSSIDIWRHALDVCPDITIFDVMKALYELAHDDEKLSTWICCTIDRRVFLTLSQDDSGLMEAWDEDEYGLRLTDWNKL
jgi:hypothetical protein